MFRATFNNSNSNSNNKNMFSFFYIKLSQREIQF